MAGGRRTIGAATVAQQRRAQSLGTRLGKARARGDLIEEARLVVELADLRHQIECAHAAALLRRAALAEHEDVAAALTEHANRLGIRRTVTLPPEWLRSEGAAASIGA